MANETVQSSQTKNVETKIDEVTVYTSRALVTRRGTVTLGGTEKELIVTGLPLTIQTESVRAGGIGTVGVRLLGVRTEHIYATEPVAERVAQLSGQIQQLEEQKKNLQNSIDALYMQRRFVEGLSEKSVERFSWGLARKQVGLDETRELVNFLGEQYNDHATTIVKREKERENLDRQIHALHQQLEHIRTPRPRESYSIIVPIEAAGEGDFELEISYVVLRASWTPLYDLRVSGVGDKVNLSYLAEVRQSSGEDWRGVTLTLSTAKPGLGTLPPKLDPWFVDIYRPAPPMPMQAAGGAVFAMAAPAPQAASDTAVRSMRQMAKMAADATSEFALVEASNVNAEVSSEGGVVTFRLDRDSDIPSDGAPHKTVIFSDDYPCRTEFIAAPRLVSFAYVQATITNKAGGATLLPGSANIFRDNTFVGTTQLENVAPGQEFKLNLGIDESLKIERDMVEREVDKRFIGNQRRITYAYRLSVINLREQEVTLRLTEQLPVSRNEQVKVKLSRINPQVQSTDMGMLEWVMTLQSKIKRELYYQFTVEHPTDETLTGLNI